jgi:hypothetical protein
MRVEAPLSFRLALSKMRNAQNLREHAIQLVSQESSARRIVQTREES